MRRVALLLLALALAGCGGEREHGSATLWITRDAGKTVVFSADVTAGLNAIQTVAREKKVTTRYGGRYLQSIDGVEGSLAQQRDWFYFVNGVEGDRSAAEVKLKPGDVLWWDFRHWTGATMHVPVVAGAYPHPFVDAPTNVVGDPALARRIAKQVHGVANGSRARNLISIGGVAPDAVRATTWGSGYRLQLGRRVAHDLADDPTTLRYRF